MRKSEHDEAVIFVDYLNIIQARYGILFTHLNQETPAVSFGGHKIGKDGKKKAIWNKNWATIRKMKQEGVKAGFPDYIIVIPKLGILAIELKAVDGHASKEQIEWIEAINSINNAQGKICYGADEAIAFVKQILLIA